MPHKKKQIIIRAVFFALCFIVLVSAFAAFSVYGKGAAEDPNRELTVLEIWQIDSFEGGKGSRAGYLKSVGDIFHDKYGAFVNVKSLTAEAARENLVKQVTPDMISYGAGTYGIESAITSKDPYVTWAHGGYCLLTLSENAEFSDVSPENTVINAGKDNLTGCAALFCGLENAVMEKPTSAYLKLIAGDYKYLLGTQRDIFRLKTREVVFSVSPLTQFNDLYQNISVTSKDAKKRYFCGKYIEVLLSESDKISRTGLMSDIKVYDDEMSAMEGIEYEYTLKSPVSESVRKELERAVANNDINFIKNLLK